MKQVLPKFWKPITPPFEFLTKRDDIFIFLLLLISSCIYSGLTSSKKSLFFCLCLIVDEDFASVKIKQDFLVSK